MKRPNGMDAILLSSESPNLHTHTLKVVVIDATEVLTYHQTFNDAHEATDALSSASRNYAVRQAFPSDPSGRQNRIEHRIEQAKPVIGRTS